MSQASPQRSQCLPVGAKAIATLLAAAALTGCRGERTLSLTSTPVGAEVRLDGQLMGVTPVVIPIDHYGTRRLTMYRTGSRLHSEPLDLDAPWWTYFPVDILTEILNPVRLNDRQAYHVDLVPATGEVADPVTASFIEEAIRVRTEAREAARATDEEASVTSEASDPAAAGQGGR
ncbi:PEGA domain-containing protein [Planctomycetota bacterium]|jgi:hypothetical protein|nr:PEGA domain-containing protein [Planctomycetota bacterium]